jgi:Zn-finger protein
MTALRFPIPPSTPKRACKSCLAPIYWIETQAGKRMPVNANGVSHFADCPNAASHRKSRESL